MTKKRRNFTPDEKVTILKSHFVDKVPVSDLCDQHGLHPTVFYRWQKAFFEKGTLAFEKQTNNKTRALEKKVSQLEEKLVKKNEIVSELMEEHVALKKTDYNGFGGLERCPPKDAEIKRLCNQSS